MTSPESCPPPAGPDRDQPEPGRDAEGDGAGYRRRAAGDREPHRGALARLGRDRPGDRCTATGRLPAGAGPLPCSQYLVKTGWAGSARQREPAGARRGCDARGPRVVPQRRRGRPGSIASVTVPPGGTDTDDRTVTVVGGRAVALLEQVGDRWRPRCPVNSRTVAGSPGSTRPRSRIVTPSRESGWPDRRERVAARLHGHQVGAGRRHARQAEAAPAAARRAGRSRRSAARWLYSWPATGKPRRPPVALARRRARTRRCGSSAGSAKLLPSGTVRLSPSIQTPARPGAAGPHQRDAGLACWRHDAARQAVVEQRDAVPGQGQDRRAAPKLARGHAHLDLGVGQVIDQRGDLRRRDRDRPRSAPAGRSGPRTSALGAERLLGRCRGPAPRPGPSRSRRAGCRIRPRSPGRPRASTAAVKAFSARPPIAIRTSGRLESSSIEP